MHLPPRLLRGSRVLIAGAAAVVRDVDMDTWSPITESEMRRLLDEELASCSEAERDVWTRVRTPLRHVPLQRSKQVESVFLVAEYEGDLLIFDDVEHGFEWCRPDSDGVIRSYGCDQAGIQARLYDLLQYERRFTFRRIKNIFVLLRAWRLRKAVIRATEVLKAYSGASQEEMLRMLHTAGFSESEAWRMFQIIPIAFCHVAFEPEGVRFERGYLAVSRSRPGRVRREFARDPLYVATRRYAERLLGLGQRRADFKALYSLTAEYAAMIPLQNPDGTFRGVCCTEPALFEYEKA